MAKKAFRKIAFSVVGKLAQNLKASIQRSGYRQNNRSFTQKGAEK
jgi:hypothetical protein